MNNRDMVDQLYVRLVNAPDGLDCSINQVLAALGMMASAIFAEGYDQADRQDQAARFCRALQACVDPARLAQRQSLN